MTQVVTMEHKVICAGKVVLVSECVEVILEDCDGLSQADIIQNHAWLREVEGSMGRLICPAHIKFLTTSFKTVNKSGTKCMYINHDSSFSRSQKRIRNLDFTSSMHQLELGNAYAPYDLPLCTKCHDFLTAKEDKKNPPKMEVTEEPPMPGSQGDQETEFAQSSEPMDHEPSQSTVQSSQQSTATNQSSESFIPTDNSQDKDYNVMEDIAALAIQQTYPGIAKLNELLNYEGMKQRMEYRMANPFGELGPKRQGQLMEVLSDTIVAACQVISPNESWRMELYQATVQSKKVDLKLSDKPYMIPALRENIIYYNNGWQKDDQTHALSNCYGLGLKYNYVVQFNESIDGNPCWTPPINDYKWTNGKVHFLMNGHGMAPVIHKEITRTRISDKVCIDFFEYVNSSEITNRCAYGTFNVKQSDGQVYTVARKIRNVGQEELVRKFWSHCRHVKNYEEEEMPGKSFLKDCLTVLPAIKSKKMKGITAAVELGVRALESLKELVDEMKPHALECDYTVENLDNIKDGIKTSYQYLQSQYVFNLSKDSTIRSHNTHWLTSDPSNMDLQAGISEDHSSYSDSCDFCDLPAKLTMILMAICTKVETKNMISGHVIEQWRYTINEAQLAIKEWRNFILRNKVSNIDWNSYLSTDTPEHAVLIIDFAMNHLPEKPR